MPEDLAEPPATRGSSQRPRPRLTEIGVRRPGGGHRPSVEAGGIAFSWQPGELRVRRSPTTRPIVGYGATATPTRSACGRPVATHPLDARRLQPRRPCRRAHRPGPGGAVSRVLYPGDDSPAGQELRLRQEYFFASASLQDMLRRHLSEGIRPSPTLDDYVAIQLNDTHPAIGIAEMMRLLMDVHGLEWEQAWAITQGCISYTNHTLLPEALEMWPVLLLERLLPRHMQIIYLLNARHLDTQRAKGADDRLLAAAEPGRRGQRPPGAHGAPGVPGQPLGQWRVGAAYRPDAPHHLPRAWMRAGGWPHRQPDQRHHLPPLAAPDQYRADQAARRHGRGAGAARPGWRCGSDPVRRGCRLP